MRLTNVDWGRLLRDLGAHAGEDTPNELSQIVGIFDLSKYVTSGATQPSGATVPPGVPIGAGQQVLRVQSAPAVGTDWTIVVPAGERWRLIALLVQFVTSAAVAPRVPQFIVDDGPNGIIVPPTITRLWMDSTSASVPAGNNDFWVWNAIARGEAVGGGASPAVGGIRPVIMPPILIPSGFRLRVATANLQAGDQWSAPGFAVEIS